jgi:hypothetical protein
MANLLLARAKRVASIAQRQKEALAAVKTAQCNHCHNNGNLVVAVVTRPKGMGKRYANRGAHRSHLIT